jgi:hypothetical protein
MKLLLVTALMLLPAAAHAQDRADPKWNAWLGCWELVVGDGAPGPTLRPASGAVPEPGQAPRPEVCVEAGTDGATFTTRVGAQTLVEETMRADGVDHPITDGDCQGTRRAEWSHDALTLYARADLACAGDSDRRRVSGMSILGRNGTWLDIQAVSIGDQETVRVRRYRHTTAAGRTPRGRARALTLEDVHEASAKVTAGALEAALIETGASFTLSSKRLVALEEAGVADEIIDLMVALSYPEQFTIERTVREDRVRQAPLINDPYYLGWAFGYPSWSEDYGFYSPLYGRYSSFFYSPFAYSYLRAYDPFYAGGYLGGSALLLTPGGGGSPPAIQPSGTGRVVNGQGYTRVRPREVAIPVDASDAGGSNVSTSGASSSSAGGSSSGGGGNSGGGTVSTGGFSSGGSSGDGGRTAQPR